LKPETLESLCRSFRVRKRKTSIRKHDAVIGPPLEDRRWADDRYLHKLCARPTSAHDLRNGARRSR